MKPSIILLLLMSLLGYYLFFTSKDEFDFFKLSPYLIGGGFGCVIGYYYTKTTKKNDSESD